MICSHGINAMVSQMTKGAAMLYKLATVTATVLSSHLRRDSERCGVQARRQVTPLAPASQHRPRLRHID
jgi:hypothetical protein